MPLGPDGPDIPCDPPSPRPVMPQPLSLIDSPPSPHLPASPNIPSSQPNEVSPCTSIHTVPPPPASLLPSQERLRLRLRERGRERERERERPMEECTQGSTHVRPGPQARIETTELQWRERTMIRGGVVWNELRTKRGCGDEGGKGGGELELGGGRGSHLWTSGTSRPGLPVETIFSHHQATGKEDGSDSTSPLTCSQRQHLPLKQMAATKWCSSHACYSRSCGKPADTLLQS